MQCEKEVCPIRPRITNKTAQNARKPLASTPESQLTEVPCVEIVADNSLSVYFRKSVNYGTVCADGKTERQTSCLEAPRGL